MKSKYASFSGSFTPLVNDGDCVVLRQVIGTILFGDPYKQLANASGEINNLLGSGSVEAGTLLCNIDDNSSKCLAINNDLISRRLTFRISKKPKKKAAKKTKKKTAGKSAKKPKAKTAKKALKKTTKRASKKSVKKPAKRTGGSSTKKGLKK